jgi:4-oxalocrotonate tautomerase
MPFCQAIAPGGHHPERSEGSGDGCAGLAKISASSRDRQEGPTTEDRRPTTGVPMPMVQITMLTGRTAEQKRKLAKRITDALVEEAGARPEAIIVAFHEVSKESYASGGVLMVDKPK